MKEVETKVVVKGLRQCVSDSQVLKDNLPLYRGYTQKYGGYTKKSLLATAIADNYKDLLTHKSMAKPISDWIVNFLNYISQFLTNNYSTNKYMFMSYIALSKELYGVDDWVNIVSNIMTSYDFSKGNENNIYISNLPSNLNKTAKNNLYKLLTRR